MQKEREIVSNIFKLDNMLRRRGNRIAGRFDATQQQLEVLEILDEAGINGLPLSELGKNLDVTKGNITGLIDRMERDGLAKRKDDSKDRRVIRAIITSKGKTILKKIQPYKDEWNQMLFQGFAVKDKGDLTELLVRLLNRVNELES